MSEHKQRLSDAQSWMVWLATGAKWEVRNLLLARRVKSKDAKARTRAVEAFDDPSLEVPYGLSESDQAQWERAATTRLRDKTTCPIPVTAENAAVVLDVIDEVLDDENGGATAALTWRLRHLIKALEHVRRGEPLTGVAEPANSNGAGTEVVVVE